jgi:NAD(P)-dependent dehydrogenase (short-subunit alcohol dehydrogenase family)
MGLEVCTQLAAKGTWRIHILDINAESGKEVAKSLGSNVHFHKTNVCSYSSLSSTFDDIFEAEGRMDFVHANAGIKETGRIYGVQDGAGPPPELNQLTIDLNLKAVVNTCYLAGHYFRRSPLKGKDANLVMTASAGSLYSLDSAPMYAASKFGVLGLNWSIAKLFKRDSGIRVNCVLPAPVQTNLVTKEEWAAFDQSLFTPASDIVRVVMQYVEGSAMTDSNGVHFASDDVYGQAAEVVKGKFYFRTQQEWCDENMRLAMLGNDL